MQSGKRFLCFLDQRLAASDLSGSFASVEKGTEFGTRHVHTVGALCCIDLAQSEFSPYVMPYAARCDAT